MILEMAGNLRPKRIFFVTLKLTCTSCINDPIPQIFFLYFEEGSLNFRITSENIIKTPCKITMPMVCSNFLSLGPCGFIEPKHTVDAPSLGSLFMEPAFSF